VHRPPWGKASRPGRLLGVKGMRSRGFSGVVVPRTLGAPRHVQADTTRRGAPAGRDDATRLTRRGSLSAGPRADTKLGVCHPRSAILSPLAIQWSLCPFCRGGFVSPLRVALHARVSPHDQHTLAMPMDTRQELTTRRGWTVIDARAAMGSGATAPPRCKGCCMGTSRVAGARAGHPDTYPPLASPPDKP
jgi:hypothetical protein